MLLEGRGKYNMLIAILLASAGCAPHFAADTDLDRVVERARTDACGQPDFDCRYLKEILDRDSAVNCAPDASDVMSLARQGSTAQSPFRVDGTIAYFGVIPMGYRYHV